MSSGRPVTIAFDADVEQLINGLAKVTGSIGGVEKRLADMEKKSRQGKTALEDTGKAGEDAFARAGAGIVEFGKNLLGTLASVETLRRAFAAVITDQQKMNAAAREYGQDFASTIARTGDVGDGREAQVAQLVQHVALATGEKEIGTVLRAYEVARRAQREQPFEVFAADFSASAKSADDTRQDVVQVAETEARLRRANPKYTTQTVHERALGLISDGVEFETLAGTFEDAVKKGLDADQVMALLRESSKSGGSKEKKRARASVNALIESLEPQTKTRMVNGLEVTVTEQTPWVPSPEDIALKHKMQTEDMSRYKRAVKELNNPAPKLKELRADAAQEGRDELEAQAAALELRKADRALLREERIFRSDMRARDAFGEGLGGVVTLGGLTSRIDAMGMQDGERDDMHPMQRGLGLDDGGIDVFSKMRVAEEMRAQTARRHAARPELRVSAPTNQAINVQVTVAPGSGRAAGDQE